jgi:hypothetical protein
MFNRHSAADDCSVDDFPWFCGSQMPQHGDLKRAGGRQLGARATRPRERGSGVAAAPWNGSAGGYGFLKKSDHFSTCMTPFMRTEWPGKLQM